MEEKKETKLVKALRKDYKELYVKEYTTGWREQRLIRNIELGIMSLKNTEEYISQELDRAREEGRREVLEDMKKMWDNDNLGDAPKYGSAGAGLMKRWIRDDINERLSKLTTK